MARLTQQQWLEAKQMYEMEPTATLESVAQAVGVSRPAVSQRAKAEEWQKSGTLARVNQSAQIAADRKLTGKLTGVSSKNATVTETSIALRANVIERHREQWGQHTKLFNLEDIAVDFDLGKRAKISAEMLMIRQGGERKAWGLDDDNQQQQPVQPQSLLVISQRAEVSR